MTSAQLPLFEDQTHLSEAQAPATQLVLELPPLVSFGIEDFLVSQSNAKAAALVESWPHWPQASAGLSGPHGSGKTHLVKAWCARSNATCVEASELSESALQMLEPGSGLAVENIDRGISDDRLLFHVLNTARERGAFVLLSSTSAPGDLDIALPDLRSRLRALPLAVIEPPDDALLHNVLVKHFSDRQLAVEPAVIAYIALRMERSMEAARQVAAAADRLALAKQRKVTKAIAAEALGVAADSSGAMPGTNVT